MDFMTLLFLGNNRQCMPLCANKISSWVRKVFSMAMTCMSLGTMQGASASAALVAGVPMVSTLPAGDQARVSSLARNCCYIKFFQYIQIIGNNTKIVTSRIPHVIAKELCNILDISVSHEYANI